MNLLLYKQWFAVSLENINLHKNNYINIQLT
jgi:hypothetical protein